MLCVVLCCVPIHSNDCNVVLYLYVSWRMAVGTGNRELKCRQMKKDSKMKKNPLKNKVPPQINLKSKEQQQHVKVGKNSHHGWQDNSHKHGLLSQDHILKNE